MGRIERALPADPRARNDARAAASARLAGAAIVLLAASVTLTPLATNDLWVHLASGRETVRSLRAGQGIPAVESFSFTAAGRPLVPHEWLSQLAFYGAWSGGERIGSGPAGVEALRFALVLTALAGLAAAARAAGASRSSTAWTMLLLLLAIAPRLLERPHLFSWAISGWWLAVLARDARDAGAGGWRGVWMLVPLQILWANLHGGFPIGTLLCACSVTGGCTAILLARRRGALPIPWAGPRRLAFACGAGIAGAAIANPAGWRLLTLPFELAGSETVTARILEWRSPFETSYWSTVPFALAALWAAALVAGTLRRRGEGAGGPGGWGITGVCTGIVFGVFAARQLRSVADFVVMTSPWFAGLVESVRARRRLPVPFADLAPAASALSAAAGIVLLGYPIRPPNLILHPLPPLVAPGNDLSAVAGFVAGQTWLPPQPRLFNSYTFGGPLAFRLPQARILFDSRYEAYGEELTGEILAAFRDPDAFQRQVEKRRPDLIVLAWRPLRPQIVAALAGLPGWKLVFLDDFAALYAPQAAPVDPLRFVSPSGFDAARIGTAEVPAAEAEGRRLLALHPRSVVGSLVLGRSLLVASRPAEARAALEACARTDPDSPALWALLALARDATGDPAGAGVARQRAEALSRRAGA